jgi:hypothetical protein
MRLVARLLGIACLLAVSPSVVAQEIEPPPAPSGPTLPDGWSLDGNRTVHEASATRCLHEISGFRPLRLAGPLQPNILGTCRYDDESGWGTAGMQVRRYMRDTGESRLAIENDRALMEPNGQSPMMMVRFAPTTNKKGEMGGIVIITKTRNGLLIDCFAEGASLEDASKKIGLFCSN